MAHHYMYLSSFIFIVCTLSEILWEYSMDSSDFSGWTSSQTSPSYLSFDSNCVWNYKCWILCDASGYGPYSSSLLQRSSATSTIGYTNTRLTYDIGTVGMESPLMEYCRIEWTTDNWANIHTLIEIDDFDGRKTAQTTSFTLADNSGSVSVRVKVPYIWEASLCCYFSRFILEADPTTTTTEPTTAQPTMSPLTPTAPTAPTAPTTPYPTDAGGLSIKVIYGTWTDDYSITNPFRWQATRDLSNYGSSVYTTPIFTGSNSKYHGKYTGTASQGTKYYMTLYRDFRCYAHSMIHISFKLIICGSEAADHFQFYINSNSPTGYMTLDTASYAWPAVNDATVNAMTCSTTPEQNTFSYTDLLEVEETDVFTIQFLFGVDSDNEVLLLHDIRISCDIITESPTSDTMDPTITSMSPSQSTTEPTINPTTYTPTQSTADPSEDPTVNPTIVPTVIPTKHPTIDPTRDPTRNPTRDPTTDNPTKNPSNNPTTDPSPSPTKNPTTTPTVLPTNSPSTFPTESPSDPHGAVAENTETTNEQTGAGKPQDFESNNGRFITDNVVFIMLGCVAVLSVILCLLCICMLKKRKISENYTVKEKTIQLQMRKVNSNSNVVEDPESPVEEFGGQFGAALTNIVGTNSLLMDDVIADVNNAVNVNGMTFGGPNNNVIGGFGTIGGPAACIGDEQNCGDEGSEEANVADDDFMENNQYQTKEIEHTDQIMLNDEFIVQSDVDDDMDLLDDLGQTLQENCVNTKY